MTEIVIRGEIGQAIYHAIGKNIVAGHEYSISRQVHNEVDNEVQVKTFRPIGLQLDILIEEMVRRND